MNKVDKALNRVAKWRSHLAGWQLGTRLRGDAESEAVRDHREATIMLRVDTSALMGMLIEKGVITQDELDDALIRSANHLNTLMERRFPGVTAHDYGLEIKPEAAGHMKDWRP